MLTLCPGDPACDFSHFIDAGSGRMVHTRKKGTTMNTIQPPCQFSTVFGTGYVPEHHSDEFHPSLLLSDDEPSELDFSSILERLRSALGIRRG